MTLRMELRELTVGKLRKRAVDGGVDSMAVEKALDSDDPKMVLLELLVLRRKEAGALADVLPALQEGASEAVDVLGRCLEHAVETLDSLSASVPRRERRSVLDLLDRVEKLADAVDTGWCEGLAQCSGCELERLGLSVVTVAQLAADGTASSATGAILELLQCLERCGNVVLRSLAALSCKQSAQEASVCASHHWRRCGC